MSIGINLAKILGRPQSRHVGCVPGHSQSPCWGGHDRDWIRVSNRLSVSRVGHEECGVEETEFSEIHKWN